MLLSKVQDFRNDTDLLFSQIHLAGSGEWGGVMATSPNQVLAGTVLRSVAEQPYRKNWRLR